MSASNVDKHPTTCSCTQMFAMDRTTTGRRLVPHVVTQIPIKTSGFLLQTLALSTKLLPRSLANLLTCLASYVRCKEHDYTDSRRASCTNLSFPCHTCAHKAVMIKSTSLIDYMLALLRHQESSKDGSSA